MIKYVIDCIAKGYIERRVHPKKEDYESEKMQVYKISIGKPLFYGINLCELIAA